MKAKVYFGAELIAETKLCRGDNPFNDVYGNLAVNDSFHKFITFDGKGDTPVSVSPDAINVQLENGCFVFSPGVFLFTKYGVEYFADIDILNIDNMVMDFITKKDPDGFVEEPWLPVTITQKVAFEQELHNELGGAHQLAGYRYFALSNCTFNDDVLFRVSKPGVLDEKYVVVHLTWSGKTEQLGFPCVELYNSFDDFKHNRMYPDKTEWES